MNFDILNEIIRDAGIDICPICGMPFGRYHYRQKTCGSNECKQLWRAKYMRDYKGRQMDEDAEAYRAKRAETRRRSRSKRQSAEIAEKNLGRLESYWSARTEDARAGEDGIYYGKRQMEKTLALVPKIDVEGFRKENEKGDDIHGDDT